MTREKKLANRSKAKEETAEMLMETIVEDLISAGSIPEAQWRALSSNPFVPLSIPTSLNREYPATRVGVHAAHALAEMIWKSREDLRQTIDREAFTKIAFKAIGDTLYDSLSKLPSEAEDGQNQLGDDFYVTLAHDYQKRLQQLATSECLDLDRHIPCHLFHQNQAVPAFSVGPVQFLPRAGWLDSFVKDPEVRDLIRQVESRELSMESLSDQAMSTESGPHASLALYVLRTLLNYGWVATVRIEGHEHVRSHLKASVMVGLAIDAIGIRFRVEDARCFTKAGRQHLFSEGRLATTLDGQLLHGSSIQMAGLGGPPGALAAQMAKEQFFLSDAGCILEHYMNGRRTGQALHLVERWTNALYWVGEARREASDFMAVVKYGCAADGLSGAGGEAKEMKIFANAALNPEGSPVADNTITVDEAVEKVYQEGRNKLAHGEMPGLLEDLAEPRAVGDALLTALFYVVTPVLADLLRNNANIFEIKECHAYRLLKEKLKTKKGTS